MQTKDPLAALRRRLEKSELDHLRQHAADLAERLEKMEERARLAEDQADWYRRAHEELIFSLTAQDEVIGITTSGEMGIVTVATVVEA